MRNPESLQLQVGGPLAIGSFIFSLIAFVTETQLTQYVQTNLEYRQPFFLFYLVHSSLMIIFPLHLLYLLATTEHTAISLFKCLQFAITNHLLPDKSFTTVFPYYKFFRLTIIMTIGITFPALLWFAAVSLASVSDVTAIWNTNAFFAYLISVKLFKLKWEVRRLVAVSLATLGVIAVVYGGTTTPTKKVTTSDFVFKPSAPLLGNLMTLVASFGYGLYQVLYKIYAALPSDPEVEVLYQEISREDSHDLGSTQEDTMYPPPFGFHPNLLTSLMGFFTFILLWIPIPFLHYSGAEIFKLPPNFFTTLAISGIALSGVVFQRKFYGFVRHLGTNHSLCWESANYSSGPYI